MSPAPPPFPPKGKTFACQKNCFCQSCDSKKYNKSKTHGLKHNALCACIISVYNFLITTCSFDKGRGYIYAFVIGGMAERTKSMKKKKKTVEGDWQKISHLRSIQRVYVYHNIILLL